VGLRFLSFSKGGKQTSLGLPASGLSYRSSRRPWGHAGAGNVKNDEATLIEPAA
jgi:hypothetical protein